MTDKHSQQRRIYEALAGKGWVPLPEILDMRVANYRARISELREQGYDIRNKTEWVNGVRRSWYRIFPPVKREAGQQELFASTEGKRANL